MKTLILISILLLTSCTIVNTEGSIKDVHYKLVKSGTYNSLEVETENVNCPIVDVKSSINGNDSRVVVECKTILK